MSQRSNSFRCLPTLLLLGGLLWLLAGCRGAPDTPLASPAPGASPSVAATPADPRPSSTVPEPTSEAAAASATPAVTPIVLAIPYGAEYFGEDYLRQYRQWGDRLRTRSGLPLELQMAPETEMEMLQLLGTGELDLAGVSPLAAIEGFRQGWIVPGVNVILFGVTSAHDITFIVRRDLNLQSGDSLEVLQQLNGLRPCWRSLPAYGSDTEQLLVPSGLLAEQNVTLAPAVIVTESPEIAVFEGRCDFATSGLDEEYFNDLLPESLAERGVSLTEWEETMQVLITVPAVLPVGMMVFSPTLSEADRESLTRALLAEGGPEEIISFRSFNAAQFERLTEIIEATGRPISPYITQPSYVPRAESDSLPEEWVQPPPETIVLDVAMGGSNIFLPRADNPINRVVLPAIHSTLLRRDAQGEWQPYLARTVPTLDNGGIRFVGAGDDEHLEITFELRPDLTWHDGEPLTADDLRFAWEYVMQPDYPDDHGGTVGWAAEVYIEEVEALNPTTVRYRFMSPAELRQAADTGGRLGNPDGYLPYVALERAFVPLDYLDVGRNLLPRHLLEEVPAGDLAGSDFARQPIYAGPYRLVENGGPGRPVVLEAFEGFALGEPEIERVVVGAGYYSGIAEPYWQSPAQLRLALDAGAIDAQLAMPAPSAALSDWREYDDLAEAEAAQVTWQGREVAEYLLFNLDRPHTSNPLVRQAIAASLDRERLLTLALEGHGSLTDSFLPPEHPLFAPVEGPDFNPDRARSLLQEAGYDLTATPAAHPTRGPLRLTLAWTTSDATTRAELVSEIQSQLAAVGIQVESAEAAPPTYGAEGCEGVLRARAWDLTLNGLGGTATDNPFRWAERTFRSDAIPDPADDCSTGTNWAGWRNPQVDALLPDLRDGRLAIEQPDDYRANWIELQALWTEELPAVTLFFVQRPVVVAHRLEGVQPSYFAFTVGGVGDTWNIHEWRLKDR